jgi:hypothetical protein
LVIFGDLPIRDDISHIAAGEVGGLEGLAADESIHLQDSIEGLSAALVERVA